LMLDASEDSRQRLVAEDLSPERLRHLDLAVLAACATGDSGDRGLLHPDSLVSALLRAGVPTVVASRWNVDSRATSRLMAAFYRELSAGVSPAVALQNAQREVALSLPHPYYWASFTVNGISVPEKGRTMLARSK